MTTRSKKTAEMATRSKKKVSETGATPSDAYPRKKSKTSESLSNIVFSHARTDFAKYLMGTEYGPLKDLRNTKNEMTKLWEQFQNARKDYFKRNQSNELTTHLRKVIWSRFDDLYEEMLSEDVLRTKICRSLHDFNNSFVARSPDPEDD